MIQNLFQPAPVASPARDSAANTEEVKTLKYQITEAKREMQSRLPSLYCTIYIAVDVEFQNFCIYQKCVMCTCTSSNNLHLQYTKYLRVCGININLPKVHVQCIFNKILKQIGITDLKEQLERSKQHVTEYQTMADNLQRALSEQSEVQYL